MIGQFAYTSGIGFNSGDRFWSMTWLRMISHVLLSTCLTTSLDVVDNREILDINL